MFKTLNQMLMKKAIIAASAAIILTAGAAASWTVFGGNEDEFFCENLEALMDSEIVFSQSAPGRKINGVFILSPIRRLKVFL